MKKPIFRLLCLLAGAILIGCALLLAVSSHVRRTASPYMLTPEAAAEVQADCILVLGCGVRPDGEPSLMLQDRLDRGLELYRLGAAPKLLMSGDHGTADYDEVNAMKDYATAAGIPSADVFMDHAGFSTYESMYRARDVFQVQRVVIVSQRYHLDRAVYDARALGLEAWGVAAADIAYLGQTARSLREVLARCKDALWCLLQPEPTFLGEAIPVWGSGDLTNG